MTSAWAISSFHTDAQSHAGSTALLFLCVASVVNDMWQSGRFTQPSSHVGVSDHRAVTATANRFWSQIFGVACFPTQLFTCSVAHLIEPGASVCCSYAQSCAVALFPDDFLAGSTLLGSRIRTAERRAVS